MLRYLPLLVCALLITLVGCQKEASKELTPDAAYQRITQMQVEAHEKCGNETPDGDCTHKGLSTAEAKQLRAGLGVVFGLLEQARGYNEQGDTESAQATMVIVGLALDHARQVID